MKNKYKLLFCALLISTSLLSQNLSINVIYKQATNNKRFTKSDEVKILKDIEYQLVANNVTSEFKLIDKLGSDANYANNRFKLKGVHYKNLETKEKVEALDFFSDRYIIKKPFNTYQWKLTKTVKIIGSYTCYRAVATIVETNFSGKTIKYDVVAWYTPTISYPYGTNGFDGLPGLILEVYWRNKFLIAKSINIKKNKKIEIKRPSYGTEITEVEFNGYVKKMIKKFSNKRKN